MTVLKPFDDEGIVLNADGTVDVLPNTPPGIYSALYEIRTGEEEVSTAEVTVEVVAFVTIAEDDLAKVDVIGDGNAILNVLDNDLLNGLPVNADEVRIGVVEDLSGGVLTLNLDGTLDVSVEAVPGTYQLIYELCDRERPSNCSRATVQVVINQADEGQVISLFIPNVITPGKLDGKNDRFVIRGIEEFQSSRITIFNRNGDHVFERENYLNDWSAEGLNGGPYYYVLWTLNTEGNEEVFKGWVHVIK
nr:gliding motility-associated C-terminal domain-containing protein [Lunatimonas sp.]